MDLEKPKAVDEIFAEALGFDDGAARATFLAKVAAEEQTIAEVRELLRAHEQAGGFLAANELTATEAKSVEENAISNKEPQINGLTIRRLLGRGGIGAVYEAYDEQLRRPVAIKILARDCGAEACAKVIEEARKAAALRDPAIVTIYAVHEAEAAIEMELIEGFPVDRATASLNFEQKARVLRQAAHAIAAAHRAGLVHRDLKPENVMVTPDLQTKVLDFGLAISLEEAGVRRGFFEGTPRYASPEQVGGKPLSPASDLFSFGSLMFKVLTGRAPFDGESAVEILEAICASRPPFLRDVAVGVPEDLQAICLACLAWKPEERPTAEDVVIELDRFLAGEPVRLRPALYGDILRQKISEYSRALAHWENQGMISRDEKDRLDFVHRRILADEHEDHWIIDARRISVAQAALYTATWAVVVAAVLAVWLARRDLSAPWTWMAPLAGTLWLAMAGTISARRREPLASASFLAGAALSVAPTALAIFHQLNWLSTPPQGVTQLLTDFSNAQVLAASLAALCVSVFGWIRLRMTGFAWTSMLLGAQSYSGFLMCRGWLDQKPELKALWLLPLAGFAGIGLEFERRNRVRWATPFNWAALAVIVGCLDVIAVQGPTLRMIGLNAERFPFFVEARQQYFSIAANGYLFLLLMMLTERARSLDLRRASRVLEPIALLHMLAPLFANAEAQRAAQNVRYDVAAYVATVALLLVLGPWRSSWRILVGALAGVAFGSYLLIDLGLLPKGPFTLTLGGIGVFVSAAMAVYLFRFNKDRPNQPANRPPSAG